MAKGTRGRCIASRQYRSTPYPLPSCHGEVMEKEINQKKSNALEKNDWEDATCSVCMEYPHNAVLLLCSSHDKGCHPYMCGTGYRYSNCLDQFKKAYTNVKSPLHGQTWQGSTNNSTVSSGFGWSNEKCEVVELTCPLCRGQVKGWTVVEAARDYLNNKKRSCMQDDCSFVGTYKELRKHVKEEHPSARPRELDPILEQKWRRLERKRERDDVISTRLRQLEKGFHHTLDENLRGGIGIPRLAVPTGGSGTTDANDDESSVATRRRRVLELARSERRLN